MRPEGPKLEGLREGWDFRVEAVSPLPPARGPGECCKLPSAVWGQAPAAMSFIRLEHYCKTIVRGQIIIIVSFQ